MESFSFIEFFRNYCNKVTSWDWYEDYKKHIEKVKNFRDKLIEGNSLSSSELDYLKNFFCAQSNAIANAGQGLAGTNARIDDINTLFDNNDAFKKLLVDLVRYGVPTEEDFLIFEDRIAEIFKANNHNKPTVLINRYVAGSTLEVSSLVNINQFKQTYRVLGDLLKTNEKYSSWYQGNINLLKAIDMQFVNELNLDRSLLDEYKSGLEFENDFTRTVQEKLGLPYNRIIRSMIPWLFFDNKINKPHLPPSPKETRLKSSLNTILYGPPGTGKTFNTVTFAMSILEPNLVLEETELENSYQDLKNKFDLLKKEGRIRFITFHQSTSYEDFVEGIKPFVEEYTGEDGQSEKRVIYDVAPGIFKDLCECASTPTGQEKSNFDEIWKQLITYLEDNEFIDIPLLSKEKTFKITLNKSGDGLTTIEDNPKFFNKEQLYRIYTGEKGVPRGGHDNYRKAVVEFLKTNKDFGLKEYNNKTIIDNTKPYVLIIDEINRGNISKIFGELITLIEEGKRKGQPEECEVTLPYSKKTFSVPSNVYIIGTMNTADRSIAIMDTALRRRFNFIEMPPKPELLGNVEIGNKTLDLSKMLDCINTRIELLFDKDHMLGHAFFFPLKKTPNLDLLGRIFKQKIIPLLQEYFYDEYEKIAFILGDDQKSSNDFKFVKEKKFNQSYLKSNNLNEFDLKERTYEINYSSFNHIESYIEIYELVQSSKNDSSEKTE